VCLCTQASFNKLSSKDDVPAASQSPVRKTETARSYSDNVKSKQTEVLTVVETNYQFAMEISVSNLNNTIASRLRAGQSTNKVSNHKRKSFLSPLLYNTLMKSKLRCSVSVAIISYTETISEQKERSRTSRRLTINLMPELIVLVDAVKDYC